MNYVYLVRIERGIDAHLLSLDQLTLNLTPSIIALMHQRIRRIVIQKEGVSLVAEL